MATIEVESREEAADAVLIWTGAGGSLSLGHRAAASVLVDPRA